MTAAELTDLLARIPSPPIEAAHAGPVAHAIDESVAYLASDAALASIAADPYWPKWDSPWWHMVVLWEIGEGARVPAATARALVARIDGMVLHDFPTDPAAVPQGVDLSREGLCHCALGCIDQVLATTGLEVAHALPWTAGWFPRYQMTDGGLNCDSDAYLVRDEIASSMVGTVPALEAVLRREPRSWTDEDRRFVADALGFLVGRALVHGSASVHNAEERTAAERWPLLTFPRLYGYDTLRGLAVLVRAVMATGTAVPLAAVIPAVTALASAFPDGVVTPRRAACENHGTRALDETGTWVRRPRPTRFALLDAVSALDTPSPYLTAQWTRVRTELLTALASGLLHADSR